MQLGMTIPLQKFLKLKQPPYGEVIDPFFCWEIHRIKHMGRSTLIAINANNRYCLLFVGMRAADWKKIGSLVINGIEQAMRSDGYTSAQIETYLSVAGPMEFTKTHGRKPVAGMNCTVEDLCWCNIPIEQDQLLQLYTMQKMNSFIGHASGFDDYGYPGEFFRDDMQRLGFLGAKILPFKSQ